MPLTPEQIAEYRNKYGIGSNSSKTSTTEPFNLFKETIKGLPKAATQIIVDPAAKFAVSALASPIDIARQSFGIDPMSGSFTLPSGDTSKTIQSEFIDRKGQVEQGNMSPLRATAGTVLDTVTGAADVLGAEQLAKGGINLVKSGVSLAKDSLNNIGSKTARSFDEVSSLLKTSIAKNNVNPQLESSAKRLFLEGTNKLESPVATYEKYLTQSKSAIEDIKVDPAISTVGENIGNAFEKVINQRKNVGKILGEELTKNGKIKINVSEPKSAFLNELGNNGLSYNPKTNSLTSFQGTKFVPEEISMLNKFTKNLKALGDNPSVSSIDNFITKTRSELNFTKGKTGVMGTTNAERIINEGISNLKQSLNPAVNKNASLAKYWQANQAYSDLSSFVDEGSTFLGKKTLSGDFAKDASLAKSSVQSILNQGKKDFLIELQNLTGYDAIDDSVMALQAMTDAGDYRGLSLLQAISDSGIPTSKTGMSQKIIDYFMEKAGRAVLGTPEQQTRAFLQSLEKTPIKNATTNTVKSIPAKTGETINKSNQMINSAKVINQNKNSNTVTPNTTAANAKSISNRIMSETIPQEKSLIKKAVDNTKKIIKQMNDSNRGFVKLSDSGKVVKMIDEATKGEIYNVVKYMSQKADNFKFNKSLEADFNRLASKYEVNINQPISKIIKQFNKLLDKTKTK